MHKVKIDDSNGAVVVSYSEWPLEAGGAVYESPWDIPAALHNDLWRIIGCND